MTATDITSRSPRREVLGTYLSARCALFRRDHIDEGDSCQRGDTLTEEPR